MADTWPTHGDQTPKTVRTPRRAHGGHMTDTRQTEGGHMSDTCGTHGGETLEARPSGHKADMLRGRGQNISGQPFFQ